MDAPRHRLPNRDDLGQIFRLACCARVTAIGPGRDFRT
jgi:hypothetical protein